jgi:uncharacterized protein (DUF427 family)
MSHATLVIRRAATVATQRPGLPFAVNDHPAAITAVDHVERVPRRIRAFLAGEKVLDTTRALYVRKWPYYSQYYIPLADVRRDLLIPEGHSQQSRRGRSEAHTVRIGQIQRPAAARLLTHSPVTLAGTVRFDWAAPDAWFEEDEQVFVPPPQPRRRGRRAALDPPGAHRVRRGCPCRVALPACATAQFAMPLNRYTSGL